MKYVLRIVLLFVAVTVVFVGVFVALIELTPFDASKLTASTAPTVIYDKNGHQYATIAGHGSYDIPYGDIPKNLQDAIIATEDHTFWNSSSIDVRGILRAAFVDLWTQHLSQGGSTIQEQLAKVVYLTDKKTFSRKFDQILLGVQINSHFSKEQILAMYLNRVYLGEGTVGVEQAAMKYFGVDLRKNPNGLTLDQAALLAGLPQAPSAYDPVQNPKAATARRNQVLANMTKYGYITQATAKQAQQQSLGLSVHALQGDIWTQHPMFAQFIFDYADHNGMNSQMLLQGGLKVYTTIDPQVESAIESVMTKGGHFASSVNGQPVPAAAVFVDPSTGGILGAAGARTATGAHGLDRAYEYGQPGSSIKPVLDYGPAIEAGKVTPDSMLDNQPHDFGQGYTPHNDEPNQPAQVTVRYGLVHSENVAAVSLLQKIGIGTGISFAERDGIQFTAADRKHLDIAIGGMEKGVTALQMAQAYEAFDNQGIQLQSHLITKIVNSQSQSIYNYSPHSTKVMSAQTAATMTDLMQGVVQSGTGTGAAVPGWGVAGKTGTVQYDAGLSGSHPSWLRLAWFDGYTPNMVGSIYMGWNYDGQNSADHMTGSPSYQCSQIFGDIVKLAEQGRAPQTFPSLAPSPQNNGAVTNLQATWNQAAGGVQLTWQSDQAGLLHFVVTRTDVTQAAGPGGGGPGGAGPGHGHGKGKKGKQQGPPGAPQTAATQLGQTSNLTFTDTGVTTGQTYTYSVQAIDPATGKAVGRPATITLTVNAGASSANNNSVGSSNTAAAGNGTSGSAPGNSTNGLGGANSTNSTVNNTTGSTGSTGNTLPLNGPQNNTVGNTSGNGT